MSQHPHVGGPDDGRKAVDWFTVLDALVWASVAVLVAVAAEWLVGWLVRERIARGADRYRAKVSSDTET